MSTYIGSAATYRTPGDASLCQEIMCIRNRHISYSPIYIRRLTVQVDATALLTTFMPQVKVSRIGGKPAGGTVMTNVAFDTSISPDATVEVRGAASADGTASTTPLLTGTIAFPGAWQQYAMRMGSMVGQILSYENSMLPSLVEDDIYLLYPGESLIVQVISAATSSNPATNHWFAQVVWEELATFAISGTVTLSGSPVQNATVFVVVTDDVVGDAGLPTNARLWDAVTTDASGNWSSTVPVGKVGAAFVQYDNSGTLYTAPGNPFLQGS